MAKVDEAEMELLGNLFSFYQKKYGTKSIRELESKFGTAARELVETGDLSESTLVEFCNQEGLKVPPKKPTPTPSSAGRSSYSDGCGRTSYRSGC